MSDFSDTGVLYTPLTDALQELSRRRADKHLMDKIRSFFAAVPAPAEFDAEARVVMAPPLVTPNLELKYFLDICRHIPLRSVFYEFQSDKFVHLNYEKHCLGELVFIRENAHGRKEIVDTVRVVDFEKDQGKPVNQITTVHGENLVDFHHRLVTQFFPAQQIEVHDFSDWFCRSRQFMPELPYLRFLGIFIADGILFSNFVTEKHHSSFTKSLVIPAFTKIRELFGVSPLIVPIEPVETDTEPFWCYYPEEVRKYM